MQITDVRVRKITKEGKMRAIVSITIDEEFVIHDIKVIEGDKGLFIAMPSKKATDGEYRDIAHPINSETRERGKKSRKLFWRGMRMRQQSRSRTANAVAFRKTAYFNKSELKTFQGLS